MDSEQLLDSLSPVLWAVVPLLSKIQQRPLAFEDEACALCVWALGKPCVIRTRHRLVGRDARARGGALERGIVVPSARLLPKY